MKRIVRLILIIVGALYIGNFQVRAEEETKITANILLEITQEAMLMSEPDEQSDVIGILSAGTPVFSIEDSEGAWIKISYQELIGYTSLQNVRKYGSEELKQEFKELVDENTLFVNELQYIETQKKHKTIWTIVIIVLVITIFAVSIVSAVLKNIHEMDKRIDHVGKHSKHR